MLLLPFRLLLLELQSLVYKNKPNYFILTYYSDTFASKTAAIGDDTADASVGNVTGSNAVNVFLAPSAIFVQVWGGGGSQYKTRQGQMLSGGV